MSKINLIVNQKLRNKINDQILDHPFTDYWDIFVLKHQHPLNIALHIIGIFIFYGLLFCSWKFHNFWLLFCLPLTQLVGLMGHLLFEQSHIDLIDAVFSWRASSCLGRMLLSILLGKYKDDIKQRQEILYNYQIKALDVGATTGGLPLLMVFIFIIGVSPV